jgi:hypothetical protein
MEDVEPACEDAATMPKHTSTYCKSRLALAQLECRTVFLVDLELAEAGDDLPSWRRIATHSLLNVAHLVNQPEVVNSFVSMLPFRAHEPQACLRITELHATEDGTWHIRTEDGEQFLKFGYLEPVPLHQVARQSHGSERENSTSATDALPECSTNGMTEMSAECKST